MISSMISDERIRILNDKISADNPFVVYWMQSSQRIEYNHALEFAIEQSNILEKPLLVFFGLTDKFPEANERHYRFMIEGLQDVKAGLTKRGIKFIIRKISPEKGALEISHLAALMVVDRGYLRIERKWRDFVASNASCRVVQVESNVIVPIESASGKEEYSAATLRSKINKILQNYTTHLKEIEVKFPSSDLDFLNIKKTATAKDNLKCDIFTDSAESIFSDEFDISDIDNIISLLDVDRSVHPVNNFKGGTGQAKRILDNFIQNKLQFYSTLKNEPGLDYSSDMSPYLHFGQISSLYIYLKIMEFSAERSEDYKEYIEELVVRRELAINFVFYNENYDSFESIPSWAKKTMEKHITDKREYTYTPAELESSLTHDVYWNAAQTEMVKTGKMHGYMRMYWGKKILEWSITPEDAFNTALYLNNKYNLDGRDPNGFAGIAWCFGKHDRPWQERNIFGNIRYMNANGLNRKFDMEKYLELTGTVPSG